MINSVDEIEKLKRTLEGMSKGSQVIQNVWATVKSVDWDKKTMVATGVRDELDYNDVLLGLDYYQVKPKVGTLCLLGMIENSDTAAFMISATEVEDIVLTVTEGIEVSVKDLTVDADSTIFNGGGNGGLVIDAQADANLNKIKTYVNVLQNATRIAITALESLVGGPGTLTTPFDGLMATVDMNFVDMENPDVKH